MVKVLELYGKAENTYAKALMRASKGHMLPDSDKVTSLWGAWTIFNSGLERESTERAELGKLLVSSSKKFDAWRHKQSHTKRRIIAEGKKELKELEAKKKAAVAAEDYATAKAVKEQIEQLLWSSAAPVQEQMIQELEKQKQDAIEKEDYDAAKKLKLEIERLRGKARLLTAE